MSSITTQNLHQERLDLCKRPCWQSHCMWSILLPLPVKPDLADPVWPRTSAHMAAPAEPQALLSGEHTTQSWRQQQQKQAVPVAT